MLDLVGEALLKTIGLVTEEDSKDGTAPAGDAPASGSEFHEFKG